MHEIEYDFKMFKEGIKERKFILEHARAPLVA